MLIAEDDASIRRLVKSVLCREGYQVDVAVDGVEAVLMLGLRDYDVIVLDLMMPNLDGFQFLATLAEHDPARLARIVVTSAASPAIIKSRITHSPFAVLPKPFNIAELVEQVRACAASSPANDPR